MKRLKRDPCEPQPRQPASGSIFQPGTCRQQSKYADTTTPLPLMGFMELLSISR